MEMLVSRTGAGKQKIRECLAEMEDAGLIRMEVE